MREGGREGERYEGGRKRNSERKGGRVGGRVGGENVMFMVTCIYMYINTQGENGGSESKDVKHFTLPTLLNPK